MDITNRATATPWTRLNNGLTVLAHPGGYAKHFGNRTQAAAALVTVQQTDAHAYVWGERPFYVVLTTVGFVPVDVVIARINAELEGEGLNPDDETLIATTEEIAALNESLTDKSAT